MNLKHWKSPPSNITLCLNNCYCLEREFSLTGSVSAKFFNKFLNPGPVRVWTIAKGARVRLKFHYWFWFWRYLFDNYVSDWAVFTAPWSAHLADSTLIGAYFKEPQINRHGENLINLRYNCHFRITKKWVSKIWDLPPL